MLSRSRRAIIAVVFVAWMCSAARARADHFDVYLLAGQSNMDGRGNVADLTGPLAEFAAPLPAVRLTYGNSTLRQKVAISSGGWTDLRPGYGVPPRAMPRLSPTVATRPGVNAPATLPSAAAVARSYVPSQVFGPEIGFGHAMNAARQPGDARIALIKFAVGNTGLRTAWNPDTRGQLYDQCVAFTQTALADLAAEGHTATLRGVLWHQGESDSTLSAERYAALLTHLITSLRRDLRSPALPFVLGEPFDNGRRLNIRAAQRATAAALPNVFWVSSGGLTTFDRGTHFDAASQITLGRRFAEAVRTKADAGPPFATAPATVPATAPSAEAATEPADDGP